MSFSEEQSTINMKTTSSRLCSLYTTNREKSWSERFLLLLLCLIISFILSTFLLLALRFHLNFSIGIFFAINSALLLCLAAVMWFSPNVRCFGILFLMSISLKQGKKQLLAVGTTVVIVLNIQNTLMNLRKLGNSLVCNLEEKLLAIDLAPLSNYIRLLHWVATELKNGITFLLAGGLGGRFETEFSLRPNVESGEFLKKVSEAHVTMNRTAERVMVVVNSISSVGKQVYPGLGMVILVVVTMCYIRKFRFDRKHKNVFLTRKFLKYDEEQRLQGKASVFPLTKNESKRYIVVPSAQLTFKDLSSMLKFSISIVSFSIVWLFFVGLDALVYWVIVVLRNRLEELKPLHVPVLLQVQKEVLVIGIPVEHGEGVYDFSYNVPIFEKKCFPDPELWLYKSVLPLSVIFGLLLLLILVSSKLSQLRHIVSEQFYKEDAERRIAKLHAKILKQRSTWTTEDAKKTLKNIAKQLHFWFPIIFRNRNSK